MTARTGGLNAISRQGDAAGELLNLSAEFPELR
jgi:hypothetical protein